MAEWLGTALQKLLQRFESASDLTETALQYTVRRFFFGFVRHLYGVSFGNIKIRQANSRRNIYQVIVIVETFTISLKEVAIMHLLFLLKDGYWKSIILCIVPHCYHSRK